MNANVKRMGVAFLEVKKITLSRRQRRLIIAAAAISAAILLRHYDVYKEIEMALAAWKPFGRQVFINGNGILGIELFAVGWTLFCWEFLHWTLEKIR